MNYEAFLRRLCRELTSFLHLLSGELTEPIAHCRGWTLHDLAEHVGAGNLWAATAVREMRGNYRAAPAPTEPRELRGWFELSCEEVLDALSLEASQEAWTVWPPFTVGFWRRRRCLETIVHRWDAERALGISSVMDPVVCAEGIAEIIDTLAPRQIKLGRMDAPGFSVRLIATDVEARTTASRRAGAGEFGGLDMDGGWDGSGAYGGGYGGGTSWAFAAEAAWDRAAATEAAWGAAGGGDWGWGTGRGWDTTGGQGAAGGGGTWNLGAKEPVATVRGTAADLFLMLWHRVSVDDPALSWEGGEAELAAAKGLVSGPLVP